MQRINSTNTLITTPEQFRETTDEIARLQLLIKNHETERDLAIDSIKEDHRHPLEEAEAIIKQKLALCEVYARQNRRDLFHGRAKSAESEHSIFGFNKPKESVHYAKGETEQSIIEKAQKLGIVRVIKVTCKLIKNELAKLDENEQRKLGVYTQSTERFYVKPKAESLQEN